MSDADTSHIESSLTCFYYFIENFNITDILSQNFADGYLKAGDLYCSSNDSSKNVQFLLLNQKLILKLDSDFYYSLGAELLSHYRKKIDDNLCIFEIDLSSCDDKKRDKLRNELQKNKLLDKVDTTFIWHPSHDEICSSSIAKYFNDAGYVVNELKNKNISDFKYGLELPKIPTIDDEFEWSKLTEYAGMIMLGCEIDENSYNSYETPKDMFNIGRGKVLHFKGVVTANILRNLLEQIKTILKENQTTSYIVISLIPYSKLLQRNSHTMLVITLDNIFVAE